MSVANIYAEVLVLALFVNNAAVFIKSLVKAWLVYNGILFFMVF